MLSMALTLALLAPPKAGPARPPQATAAFGSAQMAIAEKRWDRAVEHLATAVAVDPTYWEAHKAMGECLLKLERAADAVGHFEKWATLRPEDPEAAPALQRARSQADQERTARPLPPPAARRPAAGEARVVSLGDVARKSGKPKTDTGGGAYVLSGDGSGGGSEPIPADAPTSLLDAMRQRAESIFRPRMQRVATQVQEWRRLVRRYDDACYGKTTTEVSTYRSESAFRDQLSSTTTTRNEDTPKCREMLSDIDALTSQIGGAMAGVDQELRMPPSVYPGIREEVFSKLVSELW